MSEVAEAKPCCHCNPRTIAVEGKPGSLDWSFKGECKQCGAKVLKYITGIDGIKKMVTIITQEGIETDRKEVVLPW